MENEGVKIKGVLNEGPQTARKTREIKNKPSTKTFKTSVGPPEKARNC